MLGHYYGIWFHLLVSWSEFWCSCCYGYPQRTTRFNSCSISLCWGWELCCWRIFPSVFLFHTQLYLSLWDWALEGVSFSLYIYSLYIYCCCLLFGVCYPGGRWWGVGDVFCSGLASLLSWLCVLGLESRILFFHPLVTVSPCALRTTGFASLLSKYVKAQTLRKFMNP